MSGSREKPGIVINDRGLFFVLCLVVAALYSTGLTGSFVWDDRIYFQENDILPSLRPWDLKALLLSPSNNWGEHLPIRDALFVLEHSLFGNATPGYHTVSILLYLANGLLIFRLFKRIYSDILPSDQIVIPGSNPVPISAWYVTAIFLLHPVHVESTAYISGQKDLLYSFFSFATINILYTFARADDMGRNRKIMLVIAFLSAYYSAFLSKDTAVAASLFIPLFWLLLVRKEGQSMVKAAGVWCLVNVPASLWLIHSIRQRGSNAPAMEEIFWVPMGDRLIRAVKILGAHSVLAIKPFPLNFGYPFDDSTRLDHNFWIGFAVLALILVAVACWRRSRTMTIAALMYIIFLFPSLQIAYPLGNAFIYDRYLYMPVLGIGVIVERLFAKLQTQPSRAMHLTGSTAAALILILFSIATFRYIPKFHSDVASTRSAYRYFPDWPSSSFNYVYSLIEAGALREAMDISLKERSFKDPPWVRDYFVGWIYLEEGQHAVAISLLERSSRVCMAGGYFPFPNIPLGKALINNKKYAKAKIILSQALSSGIYQPVEVYHARKLLEEISDKQ